MVRPFDQPSDALGGSSDSPSELLSTLFSRNGTRAALLCPDDATSITYSPITDVVCHVTGALATCTGKAVSDTTVFTAAFTIQSDGALEPVCKPSGDATMRPIFCITTPSPPHG